MNLANLVSEDDLRQSRPRWSLWTLLVALVLLLLVTLVWLAGLHESGLVQGRLEQSAADAVVDVRSGLNRNLQSLQAIDPASGPPEAWRMPAATLLRERRELMRLEWRNPAIALIDTVDTTYRAPVFAQFGRSAMQTDVELACNTARRFSGAAYSTSYFVPQGAGLGLELLDVCTPIVTAGRLTGYTVAVYALQDVLGELVSRPLARGVGLAFTEADGTRLAMYGTPSAGSRIYTAQHLLDLPGNTLVLRMESRLATPALFPNVLTALVATLSLGLLVVLFLLARDMRRRMQVENDLGEALAFRKAMEDSVLTGLRARDLQGRITYVNPAFCKMVGVDAKDLLDQSFPSPYWPPELAGTYQKRQQIRMAANKLPDNGYESVFMRQDGTRFPVLIMEAPLINAVGKHTGWMSAILDVSEQRRVEELSRTSQDRLQATARLAMVGEMASLLSHELNQPLAAISSYAAGSLNLLELGSAAAQPGPDEPLRAGLIRSPQNNGLQPPLGGLQPPMANLQPPLAEDLQLAMRRIAEQAERAGKVIKSVHDFVRRREQVREAVEPLALFDAIMPLVGLQARKLGVRVDINAAPDCGLVLCDRTMVEQVLLNLSRNGMQAMQELDMLPASGQAPVVREKVLTLRLRPAGSKLNSRWVEFAVMDVGNGISEAVAAQLFTPFFTTRQEGMGLGLSLCRTVIEQHGGYLGFEPLQPHGTIFLFTLPAALKAGVAQTTHTVTESHEAHS